MTESRAKELGPYLLGYSRSWPPLPLLMSGRTYYWGRLSQRRWRWSAGLTMADLTLLTCMKRLPLRPRTLQPLGSERFSREVLGRAQAT